jgi:hypothetical protein
MQAGPNRSRHPGSREGSMSEIMEVRQQVRRELRGPRTGASWIKMRGERSDWVEDKEGRTRHEEEEPRKGISRSSTGEI